MLDSAARHMPLKLALLLAIASCPALALACPVCARDGRPISRSCLGAMIAVPYAVAPWPFTRSGRRAMTAAPLRSTGTDCRTTSRWTGFRVDELIHFTLAAITVIFVVVRRR